MKQREINLVSRSPQSEVGRAKTICLFWNKNSDITYFVVIFVGSNCIFIGGVCLCLYKKVIFSFSFNLCQGKQRQCNIENNIKKKSKDR